MLRRLALASALACSSVATALTGQAITPDSVRFASFLDSLLEAERERAGSPGAVALVVLGGRVLGARGMGYADLERQLPVDPERTVFRVGSISKSLTAIAAMQLVERGTVELHADVNEYLSTFEVTSRFDRPVTLFNLLTHTAGFEERLFGQHAARRSDWQPLGIFLANHFPRQVFEPGEIIGYNDYGSALAGLIVEQVSGQPFAEYVRQHVFEPLEMRRSSFRVDSLPAEIAMHLATAYRRVGERYIPYEYDYVQTPPAAGLVATATDMGRLLVAMLGDGSRATGVLRPETVQRLRSTAFTQHPLLRGRAYGFVVERENGLELLVKNGQATGFTTRIVLVPERDFGLFAAQTRSIIEPGGGFNEAARFASRMTSTLLDRLFPAEVESDPSPVERPAEGPPLERYVGTYRNVVGSWTTLESLLSLFDEVRVRDNGDGTLAIGFGSWVPVAPNAFQWHDGHEVYRAFRLNERGDPSYLLVDAGAYRKLAWYETSTFTTRTAGAALALGLVTIVAAVIGRARRRRGTAVADRNTPALRSFRRLALGAMVVLVAFSLSFGVVLFRIDPQRLFKGVPPLMIALLGLPVIGAVLVGASIGAGLAAWWRREGTVRALVWYSVVTLGAIGLLAILHQWHLVGFRY